MTTTKTKNSIKELQQVIRDTIKEFQTFKQIGLDRSKVVFSQDAVAKALSKKNKEQLEYYKKKVGHRNVDEKVNQAVDILFRNFDIHETTLEILKAYIDEYFDRFVTLEKLTTKTLLSIENVLVDLSSQLDTQLKS